MVVGTLAIGLASVPFGWPGNVAERPGRSPCWRQGVVVALRRSHRTAVYYQTAAMPAAALAVFLLGCALLVAALRWWRPGFPLAAAVGHVALTTAFFAVPLLTGALQVPTDLAYEWLPFADLVPESDAPRNFFQADTLLEQVPFHSLVRQRLLAGEAPLWSNELGTGQALLGNGQAAPFAPLHLLALPLAPLRGLTVAGAWQILLGLL